MRLTSQLWVSAYIRRCASEAVPAIVVRRGHVEAGAIFISVDKLDGTFNLYGPAPTGVARYDNDRFWVPCLEGRAVSEEAVSAYLERQAEFDSDLWVLAVEDKQGRHFLGETLIQF